MQRKLGVFLPAANLASCMHLNKNFIISTFILIYGWNKTFKILALAPNELFKGKHICRAVIKVSRSHFSEPPLGSINVYILWDLRSLEQKLGPAARLCLSVSAYLKYPGRPNKCHTQEKFPLLSAHLQKLAINFDHSFPLWRAGARIIPLPGVQECAVFSVWCGCSSIIPSLSLIYWYNDTW